MICLTHIQIYLYSIWSCNLLFFSLETIIGGYYHNISFHHNVNNTLNDMCLPLLSPYFVLRGWVGIFLYSIFVFALMLYPIHSKLKHTVSCFVIFFCFIIQIFSILYAVVSLQDYIFQCRFLGASILLSDLMLNLMFCAGVSLYIKHNKMATSEELKDDQNIQFLPVKGVPKYTEVQMLV